MTDEPDPLLHIFCDESRQTGNQYMLIGGMLASSKDLLYYSEKIREFRIKEKWQHPFKWEKVPTKELILKKYYGFLDYLFDKPRCLSFKCLFVDTTTFSRAIDDEERRFYKLYYYLLLNSFGKNIQPNNPCVVTLHQRTTNYKLSELLTITNNGLRKKYSCPNNLVRAVESADIRSSEMLQLVDVLIGAIGFELNGYHLIKGASRGKLKLLDYIHQRSGIYNFDESTPFGQQKFSIWHFKFNEVKSENALSSTPLIKGLPPEGLLTKSRSVFES